MQGQKYLKTYGKDYKCRHKKLTQGKGGQLNEFKPKRNSWIWETLKKMIIVLKRNNICHQNNRINKKGEIHIALFLFLMSHPSLEEEVKDMPLIISESN